MNTTILETAEHGLTTCHSTRRLYERHTRIVYWPTIRLFWHGQLGQYHPILSSLGSLQVYPSLLVPTFEVLWWITTVKGGTKPTTLARLSLLPIIGFLYSSTHPFSLGTPWLVTSERGAVNKEDKYARQDLDCHSLSHHSLYTGVYFKTSFYHHRGLGVNYPQRQSRLTGHYWVEKMIPCLWTICTKDEYAATCLESWYYT